MVLYLCLQGEVYSYGLITVLYPVSGLLTRLMVAYAIVPVLHAYPYVSIYEYIEKRFDRPFRLIFSSLYIVSHVIFLGITLYGPSLAITTVTGIPYWITVCALGLVCAFYCVIGGLKAIIWTDVFQSGLMFFCVLTVIVQATWAAGGVVTVFKRSFESSMHLNVHFPITEDPIYRYSAWAIVFFGFVDALKTTIVSQAGAQRLLCVDSVNTAIKALMIGAVLLLLFKMLTVFAALAIYANFKDCDPIAMPERSNIKTEDQLFIFAVNRFMGDIPGLQGLALAGIISATLSTCSSLINAFAVLTLEDFAKPLFPHWTQKGRIQVLICKVSTLSYALLAIAVSFITPYMGGIAKVLMGFINSLVGPLCGVMFLAFFSRRSQSKACKIAFVISLAFTSWIMIGSSMHKKPDLRLPTGLHGCPSENSTLKATAFNHSSVLNHNNTRASNENDIKNLNSTPTSSTKSEYVFPLYKISFMWLGPIGMFTTCVLGLVLSYIIGGKSCIEELFLSPWVTKSWFICFRNTVSRGRSPSPSQDSSPRVLWPEEKV